MKKLYLFIFFMFGYVANAQAPFVMTYQIDNAMQTIQVPILANPGTNYNINYGDGTMVLNRTGPVNHTYANPGVYTVTISGTFNQIKFNSGSSFLKSIEAWGSTQWISLERAFSDCGNLEINATDIPNFSQVTNMYGTFAGIKNINTDISQWDVSNVTNMSGLFAGVEEFNRPIDNWDVSSVTNMFNMFGGCTAFNQPLNNWDVSNVTNMVFIFKNCTSFNQPLSNWDVGNVTSMDSMFSQASSFNQNINSWDVSNVTSMGTMFGWATAFNQPLNDWNTSSVTYMGEMFYFATSFNQTLNNWDVSNVTDMDLMFGSSNAFNQNLSNWNFNQNVFSDLVNIFFANTSIDTANYDALLQRFVQLGLTNKRMFFLGLFYCDTASRSYLDYNLGWDIFGDGIGATCFQNNIVGSVRYDTANDGCSAIDSAVNNFLITSTGNGLNYTTSLNASGTFDLVVAQGSYVVGLANVPSYFTVSPSATPINFTSFQNTENLNFCITSNQTVEDLNVTIVPVTEARPGFQSEYQLAVQNMGTHSVSSATVVLNFDTVKQSFVSSTPVANASTSSQLTFNFTNLQSLQSKIVDFTMETLAPPIVSGGDVLNFTAAVTAAITDATPQDNAFAFAQEAVNSYDPNDKQVLQGGEILIEDADQYLDYVIRFQNTGSASAIMVRIEDVLHENLDFSTLKMVSASHAYRVQITDGYFLEFIFDDINLPHEAADAAGSNGFIAYKIKPKQNIQVGDVMTGNASIFFDYNLPIITNSVTTEVVQHLGTPDFASTSPRIYPNPTDGKLAIQAKGQIHIETVKVFSLQGKLLMEFSNENEINVDRLSAGIYLLEITSSNGVSKHKIIKK